MVNQTLAWFLCLFTAFDLQGRRLLLHLAVRRDRRHLERLEVLQVPRRPHHGHHQHRRLDHLERDPLRRPHQRRTRDWCRLDQGLHVADPLLDHVRPGHVLRQDVAAAQEERDHPGPQEAPRPGAGF